MKHIYKEIVFSFLLVCVMAITPAFFVSADHTQAHPIEQLQAQIITLLDQITALQNQVANRTDGRDGSTRVPTVVPPVCPRFTYNFYLGVNDSETEGQITELQRILAADTDVYPEALVTGYYGPLTEQAVRRYQKKHSIVSSGSPDTTGYGVVGPATRAKLLQRCQPTPSPVVPPRTPLPLPNPTQKAPVISGVSGPTALNIGQSGTWTIKASDPSGGILSYYVLWGDEAPTTSASAYQNRVQTATFSHTYTREGNFTPVFTVTNSAGFSERTSVSVNVSSSVTPYIKVLSPNGGETYVVGTTVPISFSTTLTDKQTRGITMQLYRGTPGASGSSFVQTIVTDWIGGSPYQWQIPTGLTHGQYSIYMSALTPSIPLKEGGVSDWSDASFSIVSSPTTSPSIQVVSPNGGEVWSRGETYQIKWDNRNFSDNSVSIILMGINPDTYLFYETNNDGVENWIIPSIVPTGSYRIKIKNSNSEDISDAPFNVVISQVMINAPNQPASALAPRGAVVPFTVFQVTARDVAVNIRSITVERTGLSSDQVFERIGVVVDDYADGPNVGRVVAYGTLDPSTHRVLLQPTEFGPMSPNTTARFSIVGIMKRDLSEYAGQVVSLSLIGMQITDTNGNNIGISSSPFPIQGSKQTINNSLSIGTLVATLSNESPRAYILSASSVEDIAVEKLYTHAVGANVIINGVAYPCIQSFQRSLQVCVFKEAQRISSGGNIAIVTDGILNDVLARGLTYGYRLTPPF